MPCDALRDMDWSWAGPPLDVRPLFPLERAAFVAALEDLTAEDWQRPTVCPGWRVHDVAAHVVHDQLRKLSGSRDGQAAPTGKGAEHDRHRRPAPDSSPAGGGEDGGLWRTTDGRTGGARASAHAHAHAHRPTVSEARKILNK